MVGEEDRILIDRKRRVVLSTEFRSSAGVSESKTSFSEHVRVGDAWWPQVVRHESILWGGEERVARFRYELLDRKSFDAAASRELRERDQMLVRRTDQFASFQTIDEQQQAHVYGQQARAYVGLKRFDKATEAVLAAISLSDREVRQESIDVLEHVMSERTDLEQYARQFERQSKESRLDSAIVRRAIGSAFMNDSQPEKAIPHLAIAVELEPTELDTHELLVSAYDSSDRPAETLRESIRLALKSTDEPWHYEDAMNRLKAAKSDAQLAVRVETSTVELSHGESSGYEWLAERRRQNGRLADAIDLWRRCDSRNPLQAVGLLNIARLQLEQGDQQGLQETIGQLRSRSWPADVRDEVRSEIESLKSQLQKAQTANQR